MKRISFLFILCLIQVIDSQYIDSSSGDYSANNIVATTFQPTTFSPTLSPTKNSSDVSLVQKIVLILVFGSMLLLCIIVPIIRSKNICYIGSLCNICTGCKEYMINCGCDDCCGDNIKNNCIDETYPHGYYRTNNKKSISCSVLYHWMVKYFCITICYVINIFSCPYGDSYYKYKLGESYNHNIQNDPKYDTVLTLLQQHDNKKNKNIVIVDKPPTILNSVDEQPHRININD